MLQVESVQTSLLSIQIDKYMTSLCQNTVYNLGQLSPNNYRKESIESFINCLDEYLEFRIIHRLTN